MALAKERTTKLAKGIKSLSSSLIEKGKNTLDKIDKYQEESKKKELVRMDDDIVRLKKEVQIAKAKNQLEKLEPKSESQQGSSNPFPHFKDKPDFDPFTPEWMKKPHNKKEKNPYF